MFAKVSIMFYDSHNIKILWNYYDKAIQLIAGMIICSGMVEELFNDPSDN
jgi:hypothetical protein